VGFEATISAGEQLQTYTYGHWDQQNKIIYNKILAAE
jgi:hypothetical protein